MLKELDLEKLVITEPLMLDAIREHQRYMEAWSKVESLVREWAFNKQLPSNEEIASRISYAIARQYEDAKDFEMVKSNVFSALMITLGLKDMERQWEEEQEMFVRNDN